MVIINTDPGGLARFGRRIDTDPGGLARLRRGATPELRRMSIDLRKKAEAESRMKARREAEAKAKAKAELERVRKESIRREAEKRATAQRNLNKALRTAREKKSFYLQAQAQKIFQRAITSAKAEKQKTIMKGREQLKGVVAISRAEKKREVSIKERLIEIEKGFAKTNVGKVFNVVSAGTLTDRKLRRERNTLYEKYEKFNKRYGGRELSQSEFNQAKREEARLESEIKKIEKAEDKFRNSAVRRIGNFVWKEGALTRGRDLSDPKVLESFIKLEKENLARINKKLEKKETQLLLRLKEASEQTISNLEAGKPPRILAGYPPPLLPVGAPGVPKNVKVGFTGTQKIKGNKIITDITFGVGKKRVGIAKGVTITRGRGGVSVVLGRSGVRGIKFPSAKWTMKQRQAFLGREIGAVTPAKFKITKDIKLPSGARIKIIKDNIKGFLQAGVGRITSAKGDRLISGVKKVKSISSKNFGSLSAVLTKKDLSLIIGNAITDKDDVIEFIGLIQGSSKVGKTFRLTNIQKSQYQKAINKVVNSVASASAKSQKFPGLTSTQRFSASVGLVKSSIKLKPTITGRAVQITKPKIKQKVRPTRILLKAKQITKTRVKQAIAQVSAQSQKVRQRLKQLTKQKQKVRTKLAQKSLQQTRQRLRMRLKTLTIQKSKLIGIKLTPGFIPTLAQMRLLGLAIPKRKKKKKKAIIKKKKARSYHVYARPLRRKGKRKPKLIRVTKRPIKKKRAKDLRNYIVDTSLSRHGKIKASSRKPSKRILKSPTGYAHKTKVKFRKYKIRKGKRKPLRKGNVIERRRFIQDTKQEKKKLTLKRRIAQLKKQAKIKSPKRRITKRKVRVHRSPLRKPKTRKIIRRPQSRKSMLKNLEKARRVRLQNLKTGRTPGRSKTKSPVRKSPVRVVARKPQSKKRRAPPTQKQLQNLARGRRILKQKRGRG